MINRLRYNTSHFLSQATWAVKLNPGQIQCVRAEETNTST